MARVVIVVPCYNEANRLGLPAFRGFRVGEDSVKFLFVDDGSIDGTGALIATLCAEKPDRFDLIRLDENHGKGEAVRQGILTALKSDCSFVGFWDADLATPLAALPAFLAVMRDRPAVEMVIGARVQLMGRDIVRRPIRHYLGRCVATAISMTLGLPVYDTQCGAKLFRRSEALEAIVSEPFMTRWLFDVEIIARYISMPTGKRRPAAEAIYELPLDVWHDTGSSKVSPWQFFKAFLDLWRIRRRYRPLRNDR